MAAAGGNDVLHFVGTTVGTWDPFKTKPFWGQDLSPRSPHWALPFGQGNSPGCLRLRPRGRRGRARRWRNPDAATRLRQPRWRELRAPLELGSRRLEGLRPALGRPWAPPSCAPQPGALALLRPLYRLPSSPGPQLLMETPWRLPPQPAQSRGAPAAAPG
ncbi:uncharacterized protein LOC117075152 [Trachypithecus francoisi]|uniref:uncharacterized protein LOC117075152 n=1 Tax=Trachypithecus francoisi TaxID=54180 RepID=UPI00141A68DD|nr:uncharacterized protein LOC117075152 [Trachypithecus francoisi]